MDERTSDTAETFGSQDAPSDASNQNNEEPSAPHGGAENSGAGADDDKGSRKEKAGRPGGAGEGSQATGHPENAG